MATITVNLTNVQETLVSGTNIKTVNGTSLLGSGNISIVGDGNIYDNDGTITDASRVVTLAGNANTDRLTIQKLDGTDIVDFKGNGSTRFDGWVGINSAGGSTNGLTVDSTGLNSGLNATMIVTGKQYQYHLISE